MALDTLAFCELQPKTTAIGKSSQPRLLRGSCGQALDYRCGGGWGEVCVGSVFLKATRSFLLQII